MYTHNAAAVALKPYKYLDGSNLSLLVHFYLVLENKLTTLLFKISVFNTINYFPMLIFVALSVAYGA
ncbi:hypothetical protein ACJX0J_014422, partial [Zea mays]